LIAENDTGDDGSTHHRKRVLKPSQHGKKKRETIVRSVERQRFLVLLLPRVETELAEAAVVIVADKFVPKGEGRSLGIGHGEWYLQFAITEKMREEKSLAAIRNVQERKI
jgi:hypothetical protein